MTEREKEERKADIAGTICGVIVGLVAWALAFNFIVAPMMCDGHTFIEVMEMFIQR